MSAGAPSSPTRGRTDPDHSGNRRRHLVVLRAGDSSLHEQWLAGPQPRTWDLVVSYFGDDPHRFRTGDVLRLDRKGPKWPALHHVLTVDLADVIEDYEYIWLPDDDLATDAASVNEMFDYAARYRLALSQPALTEDSYFTHEITLVDRRFDLRYTNFVEIMAPCFAREFLLRCLPTFDATQTGWGLDFHWPRLVTDSASVAIIDAVTVRHTRPVGGPNLTAARAAGVNPLSEYHRYLLEHEIYDLTTRVHSAIRTGAPKPTCDPTAICLTVTGMTPDLPAWFAHHAGHADLLFVYSDDPEVHDFVQGSGHPIVVCDNSVAAADPLDREVANIRAAVTAARAAGMTWLLPLGSRELFHDDGRRRWQIPGAGQVCFLAHEAVPSPRPVDDVFRDCTVFRVSGRSRFLDAPANRSAVRLGPGVEPVDQHGFTGFTGATGTVTAPMILHYPFPSFESWLVRATEAAAGGGALARRFAHYSRDLLQVAVAHGRLDGARACFQAEIPCEGMVDRMVEVGELIRVTPIPPVPVNGRCTNRAAGEMPRARSIVRC